MLKPSLALAQVALLAAAPLAITLFSSSNIAANMTPGTLLPFPAWTGDRDDPP
jgi:hypothetical protein